MMFLTFMRTNSIPDHLAEFYQKTYEALLSTHDSHDKANYTREFLGGLDENKFTRLLSLFCFRTYHKEFYEFTEAEILSHLSACISKLQLDTNAKTYLKDLRDIVCLLICDGGIYRFTHRSFQTYFAAIYTAEKGDQEQRQLFDSLLQPDKYCRHHMDYYTLLHQIEPERFLVNAAEEPLRKIRHEISRQPDPEYFLLRKMYHGIALDDDVNQDEPSFSFGFYIGTPMENPLFTDFYYANYLLLLKKFIGTPVQYVNSSVDLSKLKIYIFGQDTLHETVRGPARTKVTDLLFEDIDDDPQLGDAERRELYDIMIQYLSIPKLIAAIDAWLQDLDLKRAQFEKQKTFTAFIDDF